MKKQIILLLLLCLSITIVAQTNERETVIDSIATTIMNGKGVGLVETTLNIRNIYKGPNIFAVEASLYKTQKEEIKRVLNDVYSDNSAEELKPVHEFVKSEAYKRTVSYDIEQAYMPELISEAITSVSMKELKKDIMIVVRSSGLLTNAVNKSFAGTQISKKGFKIKDKEFIQLLDRYYSKQNKEALSEILSRQIEKIYEKRDLGISKENILNEALFLYPEISRNIYYIYITKEQMQYLADFYESPIGEKFTDIRIHNALNLYAADRIATIEAENEFKANLKSITPNDYYAYIAEKERMNLMPFKPIENIQTIEFKKGKYTGAVINNEPHGHGIYTNEKGIKYKGDFKEGKMHGCITMYQQNGDSLLEMWAEGKKMKVQSLSKPTAGAIKNPPTYTDEEGHETGMGYGYKTRNGVTYIGMFIDNVLHGTGKCYNNNKESVGIFHRGELVSGVVKENGVTKESERKGTFQKVQGSNSWFTLHNGNYININLNDSCTTTYIGDDILGWYTGYGEWEFKNKLEKYSYKRKGYYAYDGLFGKGSEIYNSQDIFIKKYDGEFINTKKNGKGVLTIESTNTFNSRFSTFHEEMIFNSEEEKNVITLNGTFKEDIFVEGKITLSCGDWFEGEFKNGLLVKGTCNSSNDNSNLVKIGVGNRYDGEIENGIPNGNGKLTTANGDVHKGRFLNGELIEGAVTNQNGEIIKETGITL